EIIREQERILRKQTEEQEAQSSPNKNSNENHTNLVRSKLIVIMTYYSENQ
ncbi:unnamed protein product, partial [Rotaria socialis]